MDDHDFADDGTAATSGTHPVRASDLRKNSHVVLKGFPCKIVELTTTGGQVKLVGIDIITGKKYEDTVSETADMDVPEVTRTEYMLTGVSEGYLSLMSETTGETTDTVPVPAGKLGEDLTAESEGEKTVYVTVTRTMGQEAVTSLRVAAAV
ncbi:translation initiation factor IF-5A [Streptomyces sp. WI04-05B]|uniref:translation initiation factor IF-5A n=1 Tax=Streptomyces TaxID=1883 RepID=UPI0029A502FF|nr:MULTISPECIES: translation initiation factor IF-5A [unclassified Streptomyces]MDX2544091.1 translation initiation factor IF-5A [Streptomyces sp. WI04-05B]MDX2584507.1 translation initiation factor IF-5A [Streptomyces sp. WI04-05A]